MRHAFKISCRFLAAGLALPALLAAEDIRVERIFGPEVPTGDYKHPACIEELSNGDLYLAYYGGEGEYAEGTAVFGSRLEKGTDTWTPPRVIASSPFHSLGNPVIWQAPEGTVWLFHVVRYGETWCTSRISGKISRDGARTWSDSFNVTFEEGTMVRSRPIPLEDGGHLLPIYHETGNDPEFTAPDTSSLFLRFESRTKRWTPTSKVRSRNGNLQPAVVDLSGGRMIAFCRRGGGYGPSMDGYIVRTESRDGGRTWSEGKDTPFPNPNAAIELIKLRSGRLLLVYNDCMTGRTPLTAAISADGGDTFPHRVNIAEGPGDFAYPSAVQTRDGKIHVVFTSDGRKVIRRALFEESAIVKGN
jgi:predicted neuraminidase